MKGLFATPVRSFLLLFVWCALHNSISPLVLCTGIFLAISIPMLTQQFRDPQPKIRRYGLLCRYLLMVAWDIVIANLQVIRLVIGPNRNLKPAFVLMPLDVHDGVPLAILAASVCLTPGTVSADILPHNSQKPEYLLLHVLDLQDETKFIHEVKQRYEAPLKEIFACST